MARARWTIPFCRVIRPPKSTNGTLGSIHLGRIRRTGAEHHLEVRVHVLNGAREMDDPFLPRDPPAEEHERHLGIDPSRAYPAHRRRAPPGSSGPCAEWRARDGRSLFAA